MLHRLEREASIKQPVDQFAQSMCSMLKLTRRPDLQLELMLAMTCASVIFGSPPTEHIGYLKTGSICSPSPSSEVAQTSHPAPTLDMLNSSKVLKAAKDSPVASSQSTDQAEPAAEIPALLDTQTIVDGPPVSGTADVLECTEQNLEDNKLKSAEAASNSTSDPDMERKVSCSSDLQVKDASDNVKAASPVDMFAGLSFG